MTTIGTLDPRRRCPAYRWHAGCRGCVLEPSCVLVPRPRPALYPPPSHPWWRWRWPWSWRAAAAAVLLLALAGCMPGVGADVAESCRVTCAPSVVARVTQAMCECQPLEGACSVDRLLVTPVPPPPRKGGVR